MRNKICITILLMFMLSIGIAYIFVDCCHGPLTPNLNRYSTDFSWSNLHVSAIILIEICAYIFLYPWFRYFRNFNTGFSLSKDQRDRYLIRSLNLIFMTVIKRIGHLSPLIHKYKIQLLWEQF